MNRALRELVYAHDEIADLDPVERRVALRAIVAEAGVEDLAAAVDAIANDIDGFGPLTALLADEHVTDVLVNGPDHVQVERAGRLEQADVSFLDRDDLCSWCERMVSAHGGRVDTSHPIADVILHDGSRLHVVLPPIAPNGPLVSIRRPARTPYSIDELVALGLMDQPTARRLTDHVHSGASLVVSGATGSGKTTLLDALLQEVPPTERVVSVEELAELRAGHNRVSLVARQANCEGRGWVPLDELVRAALRMRPDRIVVGEVRGAEALPALWAMSTGHRGSMLTVHARSARDARRRLVDLALASNHAPAEETLAAQVAEAVDVSVHLERRDGRRSVTEVLER
ncbi:MAG TPA: ATPase, T2SS/T4P/T4SS family [Actinomycetota bacterium]|nr:ATPase, T2SS/T4P/T4SS family [Actinomycetota bacterium]